MMPGLIALVGAILFCNVAAFSLFALSAIRLERRIRHDLTAAVEALLAPGDDNQPSALAVYSDQVATIFAGRIIQQVKAAAGGVASGVAKEAQADGLAALAGSNPWLALLSGLLPKKYRNMLLSSPQFTGQLSLLNNGNGNAKDVSDVRQRMKQTGG